MKNLNTSKTMNLVLNIRQEVPEDNSSVYNLNCIAFERNQEADLVNLLRVSKEFIPQLSLVATLDDNRLIGHIIFSKIYITGFEQKQFIGLAPMAVLPEFQKKGIGKQLVKKGLEIAKSMGIDAVFVLGHKDYYPKFGFKKAVMWNIKSEYDVPEEYFMALDLFEFALNGVSGTVRYSSAFDNL